MTKDPPFLIGEGQYNYSLNKDAELDGTLKVGGWQHFGSFSSNLFATDGLLLANPASNGVPQPLSGDDGVYVVLDQMIYHPAKADPGNGVGIFARIAGSPPDRNLVDLYADAGVNFTGMFASRPSDSFGAAISYAHISDEVSQFEQETISFGGAPAPIQNYEAALEVTYQFQVIPGWTIQPDFQYIFHPGGTIANPLGNGVTPIKDAAVIGVRTTINY